MPEGRKSLDKIPDSLAYYPHQLEGIRMMARMGSFLLCDEMGLGKSLQALTVAAIDFQRGWAERVLVVAPASLKWNWEAEIQEHTKFRCAVLDGTPAERGLQIMSFEFMGGEILIVNYEQVAIHLEELQKLKFDIIIYDECHALKNPNSKRTKACMDLYAPRRFMLTGSPMLNRVNELWVPLHMISPEQYPDYWKFVNRYCTFGGYKNKQITGVKNKRELQRHLEVMMIRRLKKDVLDLPEKQYVRVLVDLTAEQRRLYDTLKEENKLLVGPMGTEEEVDNGLAKFTRLKQICGSTYTFTGEDHSAKMDRAQDDVVEITQAGHKMVIFTQFRDVQALFKARLEKKGIKCYELHGDVPKQKRVAVVQEWSNDGKASVIICMLQVAGVGLNMTAASHVGFLDRLFVPKLNEQAEDRCHRIGASTTQPIQIIDWQCRKTVEQRVQTIINSKKNLFDSVVEESEWKKTLLAALEEADAAEEPD